MSRLRLNKVELPPTPATDKVEIYASNDLNPFLRFIDSSGRNFSIGGIQNASSAAQAISASTRTYLLGSNIKIPLTKLKLLTLLLWRFTMTKTAAGVYPSTIDIAFGTTGTITDAARVSFTKPAGTAVADEAFCHITAVVRGPLSASGIVAGNFHMAHNLASTGHATIPNVVVTTISSPFDVVTPTDVGICLTSGASDSITIQLVTAEAMFL